MTDCRIEDDVWIAAPPGIVFTALTEGPMLASWWPRSAESEPRAGGRLAMTWFSGDKVETRFEAFKPGEEVSFPFYAEHVTFALSPDKGGTRLRIAHRCGAEAIHVAQSWGFLKANLKVFLEMGLDLRER